MMPRQCSGSRDDWLSATHGTADFNVAELAGYASSPLPLLAAREDESNPPYGLNRSVVGKSGATSDRAFDWLSARGYPFFATA